MLSLAYKRQPAMRHKQRGAAAIEAALMFVVFFTLFYATVSYSLPMLMVQAFNHAAASGARSGVAIESNAFDSTADYINLGVRPRVREVVGDTLSWLPGSARQVVLGNNNENVGVDFDEATGMLSVTVNFPGYRTTPLVPTLTLPGVGDVPRLPEQLSGRASVTL